MNNKKTHIYFVPGLAADQTLQHRDAIGIWNTQSVDISITKNSKVLIVEVPMI